MNNLVLSLVPKFTKLQVLILRQDTPQLQDDAVEKIAAHCHDLQELDLSKSSRLTDRSLYALARGCPNLVKLNISACSAFSDAALGYLTGFCRKLKFLNLCGCVRAATDRALKVRENCEYSRLTCLLNSELARKLCCLFYAGHWVQLQPAAVLEPWLVWPCRWWRCQELSLRLPGSSSSRFVWMCSYYRYLSSSCNSFPSLEVFEILHLVNKTR